MKKVVLVDRYKDGKTVISVTELVDITVDSSVDYYAGSIESISSRLSAVTLILGALIEHLDLSLEEIKTITNTYKEIEEEELL